MTQHSFQTDTSFSARLPETVKAQSLPGYESGFQRGMSLKGEVWIDHRPHGDRRQTLAPGAATPPHRHDCDESVLCVGGWGEVHSAGRAQRFGAETTVILPTDQAHQILNLGTMPLELVGIVGAAAVVTWLPDGAAIHLPWSS